MPRLVLPLLCVALWSTLITCISRFVQNRESALWHEYGYKLTGAVGIDNILLTVLGFVVGLALSFRSSTAYERYDPALLLKMLANNGRWADGRKYWSLLIQVSRNIARTIWIDTAEREGEEGKQDLLGKLYVQTHKL